MVANLKRIKPPKYRVGRYVLNEYELRNLMAEVAEGRYPADVIKVKDKYGVVATIYANGRLSRNLYGLSINSECTIRALKVERERDARPVISAN